MGVKRGLGHTGFGNDLVDAGGVVTLLVKEFGGGTQDAGGRGQVGKRPGGMGGDRLAG